MSCSMALKTYILDVMDGRRKGRPLLRLLSYLYKTGVAARNFGYDKGFCKVLDAGIPVISIGNIVAGGTGKTPLVKFLAEELQKTLNVAILSRGYRSTTEKSGGTLLVTPETDVAVCGDEPYWLARNLPKAQVWVGRDRFTSAQKARENHAQVIILDDGMQHRRLKRDFEIVVVDGEDPLGKGFFLPRGLLRDAPSRLKEADLIVVTEPKEGIEKELKRYTKAPIVSLRVKTDLPLEGKKVAVFCAIGKPQRFLKAVKEAGGEIISSFFKPDHDPFYTEELNRFASKSAAELLVCTEKDFVKLTDPLQLSLPLMALSSHLEICKGQEAWQQLLINIKGSL